MQNTNKANFTIDENKFLVHFQDKRTSVVIVDYDEMSEQYCRLTDFGADVVGYLLEHPGTSFHEMADNLKESYNASPEEVESNLTDVIQKLAERSIL